MGKQFVVEVRGIACVTVGTKEVYFRTDPLPQGAEGDTDPIELSVWADTALQARQRVREALTTLLRDELAGEIQRDRGPGSY